MGSLLIKNYLSVYHILAAAYFARQSAQIEMKKDRLSSKYVDDWAIEHRALIMACIASSVSFLESTINELFVDAGDSRHKSEHVEGPDENTQRLMASLWDVESFGRSAPIFNKYQAVLRLANKARFDEGRKPFQDAKSLIDLRNALSHFKPGWVQASVGTGDQAELHSLERKLTGKFPLNPFLQDARPLFPTKCMSHGCAKWAVHSAIGLVTDFYEQMAMSNPLDQHRTRLITE